MSAVVTSRALTLPNELTIDVTSATEALFVYREIFVDRIYTRPFAQMPAMPTIVDAGANIGMFTLFAHVEWPGARVYAFEPIPQIHRVLQRNVERHGVAATLFCSGLASSVGEVEFRYYPAASVLSGRDSRAVETAALFDELTAAQAAGVIREMMGKAPNSWSERLAAKLTYEKAVCPVTTLSTVMTQTAIGRIDLLKIDVEADEVDVLRGVASEHWPRIRRISLETHCERVAEISSLLAAKGYEMQISQGSAFIDTSVVMVHAWAGTDEDAPRRKGLRAHQKRKRSRNGKGLHGILSSRASAAASRASRQCASHDHKQAVTPNKVGSALAACPLMLSQSCGKAFVRDKIRDS